METSILLEIGPAMSNSLVVLGIIVGLLGVYLMVKSKEAVKQHSLGTTPEKQDNYPAVFGAGMIVAAGLIFMLKTGLESTTGSLNYLMFAAFPYAALVTFIIGSVYRYTKKGFQVSSLSSQFLEGKQLFWGSQPFHWGILVIFGGHLIAFLFPASVIAWNGDSVRLLILEVSSFAFALSALLGLILLVKRRLTTKRVLAVTNKMDMIVYVVLFVQILSGLGVAFFARWGSSWFAGVLTPYLRSLFAGDPHIDAVSAMPWFIQIHIISAFAIIALIPFTRFVHFLVAPVDYAWRRYQVVMWNYNRKKIRTTRAHFPGRKIKNH